MPTPLHRPLPASLPVPSATRFVRCLLVALLAAVLSAALVPGPAQAAVLPATAPGLAIGTLDTDLQPWVPYEDQVVDAVRQSRFDVLALQGVFSRAAADRITADPTVKAQYGYSYFVPGQQRSAQIQSVSRNEMENYVNCLIGRGIDTTTAVQPLPPTDPACDFLGLNVAFLSQTAFETLQATMQTLPNGRQALQAIDLGLAGQGVKYSTAGLPGQLVLSRYPLTDVHTTDFTTYLIRRVNLYATVAGVRLAFVDWPTNVLADIDPGLGPLQTGSLQPETAQELLGQAVDVAVGTFNTSPSYQPEAYQLLVDHGYTPVTDADLPTYCPPSASGLKTCQGQPTRAVDLILSSSTGRCRTPDTFAATSPVSQHIGLSAVCAGSGTPTVTKADSYRLDQGTTLAVPAATGVLANDAAAGRTALLGTAPAQAASFALNPDGSFTYTPVTGFSGTDRFTYLTDDGTATPTTVTLTVTRTADLAVTLTAPATARAGGSFAATLTVRNAGPRSATQVGAGLTLPSGLTIGSAPGGTVAKDRRTVAYLAATLATGEARSYAVTITVDPGVTGAKTLTGATTALTTKDPNLKDNVAQRSVTVSR